MLDTSSLKLFFFHNAKAGGTLINRLLEAMFAPAERCPLIENNERDHERRGGDYTAFKGFRYYGCHDGYDVFRTVSGHHAVTNFRDPGARLLSLYNYYRLDMTLPQTVAHVDGFYPAAFAHRVDFHQFASKSTLATIMSGN